MKRFIELLKITGLSIAFGALIIYFTKSGHFRCSALDVFSDESSIYSFFEILKTVLIAIGIWTIGLILFYMLKQIKKISILLYFPLLTVIALHSFIIKASTREPEENRLLKQEVCSKSTDDGMLLNFYGLNKEEYDFINSKSQWLPSVPSESEIINIEYFRDGFVGDYDLQIELKLRSEEKLDSIKYPDWTFDGTVYHFRKNHM